MVGTSLNQWGVFAGIVLEGSPTMKAAGIGVLEFKSPLSQVQVGQEPLFKIHDAFCTRIQMASGPACGK